MARHLLLAMSNPVEGREADYDRWLDEKHIPELLRVPGFVRCERLQLSEVQRSPGPQPYRFLTMYEIETDDLATTLALLDECVRGSTKTDTSDQTRRALWLYTPVSVQP